jgi:hypothetical protein
MSQVDPVTFSGGRAGWNEPPTVAVIVMGFPGHAGMGLMVTVTGSLAG